MDVARELRERRQTAEEMFRRDDLRRQLRDKLLRTAKLSGDTVTEAEIEVAIGQYFQSLHTYEDPPAGTKRLLAHCWVWRTRIAMAAVTIAALAATLWTML